MDYEIETTPVGLQVRGASPELLADLLERYESRILEATPELWVEAQPGLARSKIEDLLGSQGLTASEELLVWWSWRNGAERGRLLTDPIGPVSLEMALERRSRDPLGHDIGQWDPDWIWVAGSYNEALAARCGPAKNQTLVRRFSTHVYGLNDDGDVTHQVASLCTPLAMFFLSVQQGWVGVSDGVWFNNDHLAPGDWQLTGI